MFRFIFRRLLQVIPVIFVIITATFFMVRLVPGGPFLAEKSIPPEVMRNLEAHYGLDQPLWRQYLDYLGSLARGDLGAGYYEILPSVTANDCNVNGNGSWITNANWTSGTNPNTTDAIVRFGNLGSAAPLTADPTVSVTTTCPVSCRAWTVAPGRAARRRPAAASRARRRGMVAGRVMA